MKFKLTLFAVLLTALAIPQTVRAYDFSATAPSGQTLFYNIVGGHAEVVRPDASTGSLNYVSGNLIIPDTVNYNSVAYAVTSISSLSPSNGLRGAFQGCRQLISVIIPNTVIGIGELSFFDCFGLTSVTIGSSVSSIGHRAFENCIGLNEIVSLAPVAPYLEEVISNTTYNAFYGVPPTASVNIPCGSSLSYYSRWYHFSNFSEATWFTFSAQSVNDTMGNVSILTQPTCLMPIAVCFASANNGYRFSQWNDGCTSNPRSLTMTQDTSLTAYFVSAHLDTIIVHDTTIIRYYQYDTTIVNVFDTVIRNIYQYDTTIVNNYTYDTNIYNLYRYDTTLVFDTMIVNVYTYDTSIYNNYRFDTVILNTYQYDTTLVNVYDTIINNYYQYDTTIVYDTTIINVYDTTIVNNYQYDTIIINNYVYDTVIINNYSHDTVNNYYHDTVNNYYYDTVIITHYYHDTVIINNYIYDTIYLYRYLHDTIYIHDTIFVGGEGIGDVKMIDAKIYARDGQIVVEGAEGMPVVLYDAVGRQLVARREEIHGGAPLRFDVPASGVYLVKVGTLPAKKVVLIK